MDSSLMEAYDEDVRHVEAFLDGNTAAFERLYEKYYEKVRALARGILINPEDAADAVQEVFALVYRNLARFNRKSKFGTWLFRVAINRIIQHGRRLRSQHKTAALDEAVACVEVAEFEEPDPDIERAMRALSPADRAILVLFYWEELSLQEIGESLGCGVNAAKTRLYRARERFRTAYVRSES
jgi:RNA polymerase sigma-70 factor (ECF subfamily)